MPTERNEKLFIEWSHKVLEELTTLNARFESLDEKHGALKDEFENRLNKLDDKLEKVNTLLNGNGTPERGLVVRVDRLEQRGVEHLEIRVDRLEQSEDRRTWLLKVTIVACLGAITATVISYFKK